MIVKEGGGAMTTPVRKVFTGSLTPADSEAPPRTVRFRVTTGDVDREGDTIDPRGWDVQDFLRSPSVLFAHDYRQPPIGRALTLERDDRGLSALIEFAPAEMYGFADTIYRLVRGGFLNSTSVGFQPLEWTPREGGRGTRYTRQSLLEISVVPIPANPHALVEARQAGIDVEPLRTWATRVVQGGSAPLGRNLDVTEAEVRAALREAVPGIRAEVQRQLRWALTPGSAQVLTLDDDDVLADLDSRDVAAVLRAGLSESVRRKLADLVARARGRVD